MNTSFEFFPPKTEKGKENLVALTKKLSRFSPEYFSVTFGAGGSTREGTLETCVSIKNIGQKACPHLSGIGAFRESISEVLDEYKLRIILHSFEGNQKQINEAIKKGYYFSVPTSITRSTHFQNLVNMTPLSKLLTETDAPFLPSILGQRNEPAFIKESIKKMADIKQITEKEAANNLFLNYKISLVSIILLNFMKS